MAEMEARLSSYISTCQKDPELKSYGDSFSEAGSNIVSFLDAQSQNEYSSIDSAMGVCRCLLGISQNVASFIIGSREDVWKNEELKSMVNVYFDSTKNTLDLLNTVEKCVAKTETIQFTIQLAVKQFKTESMDSGDLGGNDKKMKYTQTLEELDKVKAMGDPFGVEFKAQYDSVREQQESLLKKLRELEQEFDKKYSKSKKWKKWSIVLCAAMAVSVVVLSLAAAMIAPPLTGPVAAVGLALAQPVAAIAIQSYTAHDNVKKHKDLLEATAKAANINFRATETIYSLVDNLHIKISSILDTVDLAVGKRLDLATKDVMGKIMNKVDEFTEKIAEVTQIVAEDSKLIVDKRNEVLRYVANANGSYYK